MSAASDDSGVEASTKFVNMLVSNRFDECYSMMDDSIKKILGIEMLGSTWVGSVGPVGKFVKISDVDVDQYGEGTTTLVKCAFDNGGVSVRLVFNKNGLIAGMNLSYYTPDYLTPIPDYLMEEKVTIGTEWELDGFIASKKGCEKKVAAVMVQGSGSTDKNETVYANRPFRDIAWGLAEKGISTIRYDKRTFTYATELASNSNLTVEEEVIEDAIFAGKLLKEKGYENIFLIGHSMGGMLAPRIISESGDLFCGLISMAGSPRTLGEIMIDQNDAALSAMPDSPIKQEYKAMLDVEKEKCQRLCQMSDDEAKQSTLFGIPAFYFKEMASIDASKLALSLKVPMFFLQGRDDFQVDTVKDFGNWKKILRGKGAEFVIYDGLNHLFMTYRGPAKGTVGEYMVSSEVDKKVVSDIADFINGHL